jgi:hypothetical protein
MLTALIGLMFAIGLTVGSLAWRIASAPQAVTSLTLANPAVGYAFYDAIDQVLAGEYPSALEALVSDGFIDHEATHGETGSAGDLIAQLIAFRQSFPGTRIEVDGVQAASSTLVVAIAPLAPSPASVAGLPLTIDPFAGGYEVLWVRNGQISERWSGGLPGIERFTFDDAQFTMGATLGSSISLDRIALPVPSLVRLPPQGQSTLMVESGTLRVSRHWMKSAGEVHSGEVLLGAGEAVVLPNGASITLEPDGEEPVQLLRFSMQPITPVERATPVMTGGAQSTLLWTSNLAALPSGRWTVSIGAVRFQAGTNAVLTTNSAQMLLACDGGSVHVTGQGGSITALQEDYWPSGPGVTTIESDRAASVAGAESVTLRSASDATIWVVAVTPENSSSSPSRAGSPVPV